MTVIREKWLLCIVSVSFFIYWHIIIYLFSPRTFGCTNVRRLGSIFVHPLFAVLYFLCLRGLDKEILPAVGFAPIHRHVSTAINLDGYSRTCHQSSFVSTSLISRCQPSMFMNMLFLSKAKAWNYIFNEILCFYKF